jgi:hypothetical protein
MSFSQKGKEERPGPRKGLSSLLFCRPKKVPPRAAVKDAREAAQDQKISTRMRTRKASPSQADEPGNELDTILQ